MNRKRAIETLRLPRNFHVENIDKKTLKKHYIDCVKRTHPDKTNADTKEEFVQVHAAYEYLKENPDATSNPWESQNQDSADPWNAGQQWKPGQQWNPGQEAQWKHYWHHEKQSERERRAEEYWNDFIRREQYRHPDIGTVYGQRRIGKRIGIREFVLMFCAIGVMMYILTLDVLLAERRLREEEFLKRSSLDTTGRRMMSSSKGPSQYEWLKSNSRYEDKL